MTSAVVAQIPPRIHPNAMLPANYSVKTKHGRDTDMECLRWEILAYRLPINLVETFLELCGALNHCQPISLFPPSQVRTV